MIGINSEKVFLRTLVMSDVKDIYNNISKEVIRSLPDIPWPYKLRDAKDYILKSNIKLKNKEGIDFGILLKNKIIGTVSLDIDKKHKKARLSYLLNKHYWGKGIMSEAVRLILDFGFKKLRLNKIYTGVSSENKKSHTLLIKSGFKRDRVNRKHLFFKNKYYDEIILSLLKSEYKNDKFTKF